MEKLRHILFSRYVPISHFCAKRNVPIAHYLNTHLLIRMIPDTRIPNELMASNV